MHPKMGKWGTWNHPRGRNYLSSFCYPLFYRGTGLVIKPGTCVAVQLTVIKEHTI